MRLRNGVAFVPALSGALGSAFGYDFQVSNRVVAASEFAQCNGVVPLTLVRTFGSAPFSSNLCAELRNRLSATARCNGVIPLWSWAFGSAPA